MEERIAALEAALIETTKRLNHHGKLITEHHNTLATLPADLAARLEALEAVHAAERAALLRKIGLGE